jgi:hypothetical protein
MHDNTILNNVSILLAWLSAAGKEVVLYLVARNTLYKKIKFTPQPTKKYKSKADRVDYQGGDFSEAVSQRDGVN